MRRVFVSHSSKDRPRVDLIRAFLEGSGIPCWVSYRDEPPLQGFEAPIVRAIQESAACLIVLTGNSLKSDHVATEVSIAFNSGRQLIPFRLEDIPLTPGLVYYLGRVQFIDGTRGLTEGVLQTLGAVVRGCLTTPESPNEKVDRLEQAAVHGNAAAQTKLGQIYLDLSGPNYNPALAVHWFRSAGDRGDRDGSWNLANCYREGVGAIQNEPEAIRWYETAAKLGHSGAQLAWGMALLNGHYAPKDPASGAEWLRESANQGNAEANYQLATLYLIGVGVRKDTVAALDRFKVCAAAGHAGAEYRLAVMLARGIGTRANGAEAKFWADRAARRGHESAQRLAAELENQKGL